MANDIHSRAYKLFQASLERPEGEREAFVAAEAALDPEAVDAASRMIREFEEGDEYEVGTAVRLPEWARDRQGSIIKGWHVDRHLALGGFGRVYRSWRPAPGGNEEAAIKFLDMAPDQVRRFLSERQMLADLNHDGICKFIDGGETEGGVPYMVMEYVAGLPITRHCDYHRMTVTERLKLFVRLCHAVEYAHQHLVLHRDLKPANIFVTAAGAVRVLDFGIAKLLDLEKNSTRQLTKPGDTPWTKAYASPEQVRGEGLSFATDVYALGVLLYELMTGQLPFSSNALSGPDWIQVISEREPLSPSHALLLEEPNQGGGTPGRPPETAAQSRGASPSRLNRILAGNLDAVILKALSKHPDQRYQRVDRLRLDIEHFLEGMPVTARRSSMWERVRNWSSRHRFTATVAAMWSIWLMLTLNLGLIQDVQYQADLRGQQHALRRLRYLAEIGMPSIEKALSNDAKAGKARQEAAQIHTRLLRRMATMPSYTLTSLDSSMAASALQCGRLWRELGDLDSALEATSAVLPRIVRHYELDRRDRQWRVLYVEILSQRVEIYTLQKKDSEAADASRRLADVEARRY